MFYPLPSTLLPFSLLPFSLLPFHAERKNHSAGLYSVPATGRRIQGSHAVVPIDSANQVSG